MKYTVKTACLLLFVLIVSCNSRKEMGTKGLETIRVPLERNDAPGLFDSIFEMNRFIILVAVFLLLRWRQSEVCDSE